MTTDSQKAHGSRYLLSMKLPVSLPSHQKDLIKRILTAALVSVNPEQAVLRYLRRTGDWLSAGKQRYDLNTYRRVYLVGIGKAASPMMKAALKILGERAADRFVITKAVSRTTIEMIPNEIEVLEGGHPIPTERSVQAGQKLVQLLSRARKEDLIIFLLSGGGSSLVTLPAPGISLADLQATTTALLKSGADISQLNCIRKHLDLIKGGGLARLANGAQVLTLILSDVIGDRLDVIASGPTAPDPTTYQDAWQVFKQFWLVDETPAPVIDRIQAGMRGEIADTPKAGDPLFLRVDHHLLGSNRTAVEAALAQASDNGLKTHILTTTLTGEARDAGRYLASSACKVIRDGGPVQRPACLAAGGETTVTLTGNGKGGRNLEVALGAVKILSGVDRVVLVTLATDGEDANTGAAGAVVTGRTLEMANSLGIDPEEYLRRNDSYTFFSILDDLIITGPTLTNVNDLSLIFLFDS
jgi:glycerate 2-kinase